MEDMVVNGLDRQSVDFISAKVNHIFYVLLNFRIYHKELFFSHSKLNYSYLKHNSVH